MSNSSPSAVRMKVANSNGLVKSACPVQIGGRNTVLTRAPAFTGRYVHTGSGHKIVVRTTGANNDLRGKTVGLAFDPAHLHFFDENELAV